jgi:hypothetical protein
MEDDSSQIASDRSNDQDSKSDGDSVTAESEEGYDTRQDEEKQECADEAEAQLECIKSDPDSADVGARREIITRQRNDQKNFAETVEINSTNPKNGKIKSYSHSKFISFVIIEGLKDIGLEINDELKEIAFQILKERGENDRLFVGVLEARRRIDIDSILRLVFKNVRGVQFEIEGEGVTLAGGKIDYIVIDYGKRIGVIEAKRDDKTMEDALPQLYHEMMAITMLPADAETVSYVFGFLTDGLSWSLHIADYRFVKCCGTFTTSRPNDVARLIAALRRVVFDLAAIGDRLFDYEFNDDMSGSLISSMDAAKKAWEDNTP